MICRRTALVTLSLVAVAHAQPAEPDKAQAPLSAPTTPGPAPTPEPLVSPRAIEPAPLKPEATIPLDTERRQPVRLIRPVEPAAIETRPVLSVGGWRVHVSGFVQVDWTPWSQASLDELDPSTRESLNETGWNIPRARLRAEAQRDSITAAVELDGNTTDGATGRLLGANVGWSLPSNPRRDLPLLRVTAGLLKIPFGVEVPASERDKAFLEPPAISRALFPGNYDLGAIADGAFGLMRWSIALMNGAPVGDAQWHGKDPSASYDLVGRVGLDVAGPRRSRLIAGISALRGKGLHPGIPPTKNELQWIDEDQDGQVDTTELQVLPGTPGEPSVPFDHNALNLDLEVRWCLIHLGAGRAFGEVTYATNLDRSLVYADPIATTRDLRETGIVLGIVQSLTPWAMAGVRYDRYDADRDASQRAGLDLVGVHKVFSTLSVMAAGRYRSTRLLAQYDHERNPFGRDDSGLPVTRAEDRFTIRAQAEF